MYQKNPFVKSASITRKSLIEDINRQLINLAFYPEFENKFPGAEGRSKQDKIDRGGLTKTEYDAYKKLNELLVQYKQYPYELSEAAKTDPRKAQQEIKKLNVNSVVYHLLYDLEKQLNDNPKATLRDVVDSDDYKKYAPKVQYKAVQKDVQNKVYKEETEKRRQEEDKAQGYKIRITDKTRGQFDVLKKYSPEWWEVVDRACKTKKLVLIDTGEIVPVKNEQEIWKILNTYNAPNSPMKEALHKKFEEDSPTHLWKKAHDGEETAFDYYEDLTRAQVRYLNKFSDAVYHNKSFQISPISEATVRHAAELASWGKDNEKKTKEELTAILDQWMQWVAEINNEIRQQGIPKIFVRYIDLSDNNGTWYKNTYKSIKADIDNGKIKYLPLLCDYIFNSALASTGNEVINPANKISQYVKEKPTTAMSEYDRVITALVA